MVQSLYAISYSVVATSLVDIVPYSMPDCAKIRSMKFFTLYVFYEFGSKSLYLAGANVCTNDCTPLKGNLYLKFTQFCTWHFYIQKLHAKYEKFLLHAKIFHSTVIYCALYIISVVRWQPEFQCTVQFADLVPDYNAYHSSVMVYYCV